MTDRETGKTTRRLVQRTRMNWYVFAPPLDCDRRETILPPADARNELVEDSRTPTPAARRPEETPCLLSRSPQHRLPRDAARARGAPREGAGRDPAHPRRRRPRRGRPARLRRNARRTTRGSSRAARRTSRSTRRGRAVVPGLVDAHTHPVWLGDRGAEIAPPPRRRELRHDRRGGRRDQRHRARDAGGLRRRRSRPPSREAPRDDARARHDDGRGQVGLRPDGDRRDPGAARFSGRSRRDPALPRLVPTLLAAHEVPPEFTGRPRRVGPDRGREDRSAGGAGEASPRFCDVFCEEGVFTVEESRTISRAARRAGLGLRVHADELARSGGAMLAAELSAASADHLLFIEAEEIAALARSGTVAVILPGTAWWMRSRRAPARALDRGRRPGGRGLGRQPRHLLHRVARRRSPPTPASTRGSRSKRR